MNTSDNVSMGVGSLVRFREVYSEGEADSRFLIVEDYGDGRVRVKDLTSLTSFGFSTYTYRLSDFVPVTDKEELYKYYEIVKSYCDSAWIKMYPYNL